jgi:hypothetical protein
VTESAPTKISAVKYLPAEASGSRDIFGAHDLYLTTVHNEISFVSILFQLVELLNTYDAAMHMT